MKIDMSLKMNRPTRTHYRITTNISYGTRILCICGKDVSPNHYRANTTDIMDSVSCPHCIEELRRDNWYCPKHGFIADKNVNNDETCDQCGRSVI